MHLGWHISIAGHLALILLLLWGGVFSRDRLPELSATDVSILSAEEFAALTPPEEAPSVATDAPDVAAPEEDAAPEPPPENAAQPELATPEPVEAPSTTDEPEVEPPPLIPDAVVEDDAPVIDTPPTMIDGSSPLAEAVPDPAPRVAPTPQVAPPPEAERAPEAVPDVAPEAESESVEEAPEEPAAAPEEAADRVVTEAEEDRELAPASSMRPRTRPARPTRVAEPAPAPSETPAEETPSTDDAVRAALQPETPAPAPGGPPLTGGEKDAFRVAVGQCWVVDTGAQSAGVTVVVGFSLDPAGRVVGDIRQIAASGGDASAQRSAYERARRAVLRCQRDGYDLPAEKYASWRNVEITFNPEGMQFR